jgi:probable rRNA maturation factor
MMLNQQKKVQLAIRPLEEFLAEIQKALHIAEAEVSIAFVADRQIAKWNLSYRKKKGPTDVLSFPAQSLRRIERHRRAQSSRAAKAGRAVGFLGDIAIAPETARRYAKKNNRSVDTELRVLMLHGVLHLMGYDHESDQGQMNRIEQKLRRRLGIA